jgi:hypothetical protein
MNRKPEKFRIRDKNPLMKKYAKDIEDEKQVR